MVNLKQIILIKKSIRILCLSSLGLYACDDDQKPSVDRDVQAGHMGGSGGDTGGAGGDAGSNPVGGIQGGSGGQVAPPPHLDAPRAALYTLDPVSNQGELTEVELTKTTHPDGRLTSEAVEVFNCLNEPGGLSGEIDIGLPNPILVSLCKEEQVVRPDADGHYLSIEPPSLSTDPNDRFAELMMYYHVNRVFEYYRDRHEYTRYDRPLPALVNVQLTTTPALPIPGLERNDDGFIPLDNALFFPKENWELFASQFGLPARDSDMIVFFQGKEADFSYDASVIYHEYTHAIIGIERLQSMILDEYGVDSSPQGMNEGLADYFAASPLEQPIIGPYGIGSVDPSGGRDLRIAYRCPQDTHWEVHVHGRVIGSTMWALRERLGAELADQLMFDALALFNISTTHQEAGELLLAQAELISTETLDITREVLTDFGLIDCVRSRAWESYSVFSSRDRVPYAVLGTQSIGIPGLRTTGVPAYKQFYIDLPEGAAGVTLGWSLSAQQGGFGGNQPPQPLSLVWRRGEPVSFSYNTPVTVNADGQTKPELSNQSQTVTLSRTCFTDSATDPNSASRLHTIFLNQGANDVQIPIMTIQVLDSLDGIGEVEDCLADPPMGGAEGGSEGGIQAGGTETGGTETGGTETGGTENGGTETGGTENGGTETGGTEAGILGGIMGGQTP